MKRNYALLALLLLWPVGLANADIVPVGEFSGDSYEGFENIIPPGPYSGPMPIFEGAATIDDNYTDPWIAVNLSSGEYELLPYNGNLMGLTPTGWTIFDFATPVQKFGGYMGVVNVVSGGNVSFFDVDGALIDTLAFDLPQAQWTWAGWESDVPVSRIEVHAGANPGFTTVFDDMEVTFVPEPCALGLLAVGAVLLIGRRR